MDNRLDFDNYNYQDMNFINEMLLNNSMNNYNDKKDLAGSYDGYIRGNMFNELYDQYKNYRSARLIPNSEQAELLLNLNQLCFAAYDIRLYLDNHPDDKKMLDLFNKFQMQSKQAEKEYESKYGPISMNALTDANQFNWVVYNWPWDNKMEDR